MYYKSQVGACQRRKTPEPVGRRAPFDRPRGGEFRIRAATMSRAAKPARRELEIGAAQPAQSCVGVRHGAGEMRQAAISSPPPKAAMLELLSTAAWATLVSTHVSKPDRRPQINGPARCDCEISSHDIRRRVFVVMPRSPLQIFRLQDVPLLLNPPRFFLRLARKRSASRSPGGVEAGGTCAGFTGENREGLLAPRRKPAEAR